MLLALQKGQLTWAQDALVSEQAWCPACKNPVILKRGAKKVAHFAHRQGSQCGFSEGETEEHLKGKGQLYRWATQHGHQPQLEVYLPAIRQRPDLLLTIAGQKVALEFQCSPLSLQRLIGRNDGYRRLGIQFYWLLGHPYRHRLHREKVAQFTHLVGNRPALLYWNTARASLEVDRSYFISSFRRRPGDIAWQVYQLDLRQHYRDPLAREVYQLIHRPLATCPLICHDYCAQWPVTKGPLIYWRIIAVAQLTAYPLFTQWSLEEWQKFLMSLPAVQWLTFGCASGEGLYQQVLGRFTNDLVQEGYLLVVTGGVILVKRPQWYRDIGTKLQELRRNGGSSVLKY